MEITNKKKFILFLFFLFVPFLAVLAGGYFFIHYQINTPLEGGTEKNFLIEKGESLKEIADNLEKERLIRSSFWFSAYVLFKGWAGHLMAGEYSLSPSLTIPEITLKITDGQINSSEVKITIPEGFTLKKIDARLAKAGLIQEGELLQYPELEGYLFPDTYWFKKGDELEKIISKMRQNFDEKVNQKLRDEISKQGKTLEQIIIMASLLEKEVSSYEDRRIVSGIFWKRIEDNYPLQSDASLSYIFEDDKPRHTLDETKVDSPYNTYQNIGLPPGPINSPGLLSIKAAIYPLETDYYFFLSAPNGETIFSKTLEEHNKNKIKYFD
jgi:UPF0755 protein